MATERVDAVCYARCLEKQQKGALNEERTRADLSQCETRLWTGGDDYICDYSPLFMEECASYG